MFFVYVRNLGGRTQLIGEVEIALEGDRSSFPELNYNHHPVSRDNLGSEIPRANRGRKFAK